MPERASAALQVIHSDICGPFEVASLGGSKYFITFVDEYTRMMWLDTIKLKSEALDVFKRFKVLIEKDSDKSIKILRTYHVHKDEVQYNHIYLDSSDELDGEEGYEEVEPVNGGNQNQGTNHEVDMHSSSDGDDRIHLSARPQRIKHVPARSNDCEVTHDSAVNDKGELINYALRANSEPVNFRDALKSNERKKTMEEEFKSIEKNQTWKLVVLLDKKKKIDVIKASEVEELKCKLKSEFEMTDLDKLSYFLGMEFMIGTLRYVCNSKPEVCYSVSVINKFMHDPRKSQLPAAKSIFWYLK
ncbi:retrovirus-related Pol polyprotein from transposon TNT 1-94, partial [Trifolium pratense]